MVLDAFDDTLIVEIVELVKNFVNYIFGIKGTPKRG